MAKTKEKTMERGIYLPESLPETLMPRWRMKHLQPLCIVVYQVDGYNAEVIEVLPITKRENPEAKFEAVKFRYSNRPNWVVELRPTGNFIKDRE